MKKEDAYRSVEKVSGICGMRRVLARQHVSPDGLLTRLGNMPSGAKPYLALIDNWEELDLVPSRYSLDDPRLDAIISDQLLHTSSRPCPIAR